MKTLLGIDPGSEMSGIIVITDGKIRQGYNIANADVMAFIRQEQLNCEKLVLIIEDMRPYNMRITAGIIKTIKFLGQLEWRLTDLGFTFKLIPRWEVKQWIFLQFKTMAVSEIEKNIIRSNKRKVRQALEEDEEFIPRNSTPTFVYVDDRIVANAMRKYWGIQNPSRVGQKAAYGLKDHSWQALGLASYYMALNGLIIRKN